MNSLYLESSATYFFNLENINLLKIIQKNGITPSIYNYVELRNQHCKNPNNLFIIKEDFFSNMIYTIGSIIKKIAILIGKGLQTVYNWFKKMFIKIDVIDNKIKKLNVAIKTYTKPNENVLNVAKDLKIVSLFTSNEITNMVTVFDSIINVFNELNIVKNSDNFISKDIVNFKKITSFYSLSFKSNFLGLKNSFIETTLTDTGNIYVPNFKIITTKHIDSNLIELGYLDSNLFASLTRIEEIYKTVSSIVKKSTNNYKIISKIKDKLTGIKVKKVDNSTSTEDLANFNDWFMNLNNVLLCLSNVTIETNNFLTDINMVLDYYNVCLKEGSEQ